MTEYFVFCEYDDYFCPRAIFIPLDSQDPEIPDKINQIVHLGNLIENCYKKEDNMQYHIGYKIKGLNDTSDETKKIISYWSTLLYRLDHDHEGELPDEYRCYYINDVNRGCSPSELYKRLSEMTQYENKPIIVKQCVMVSSVPFDVIKLISLEFFLLSKHEYTSDQIKELMLNSSLFDSVVCAKNDDDTFAGYGFVQLNDDVFSSLLNKCLSIDGVKFGFR